VVVGSGVAVREAVGLVLANLVVAVETVRAGGAAKVVKVVVEAGSVARARREAGAGATAVRVTAVGCWVARGELVRVVDPERVVAAPTGAMAETRAVRAARVAS